MTRRQQAWGAWAASLLVHAVFLLAWPDGPLRTPGSVNEPAVEATPMTAYLVPAPVVNASVITPPTPTQAITQVPASHTRRAVAAESSAPSRSTPTITTATVQPTSAAAPEAAAPSPAHA